MRLLKIIMPLLVLLIGSTAAHAQDEGVVYTLTKRCIPADAVSGYPSSDTYTAGTSVYLNAYAKTGFSFVRWEDEEGNEISTSNGFYYTMPSQDVILIARFEYNPDSPAEPTVPEIKKMANVFFEAYPADGGSTSQSGEYEVGTEIYVSASSASGFRFINWTKNDEVINTYSSFYYTVEEGDQTLAAHFQYDPSSPSEPSEPVFHRNLTLKANPANAVSSFSGDGGHINGSTFTVSATVAPNVYYTFDNWTDENGDIVSETLSFSYTMPNRNSTLTANFRYDFNPPSPDEPGAPSIDDQGIVGKPRMTMQDDTHVLILCATPGATIHYTLDGTEPTTASDVYTDAVFVPGNIIVKAIAVKEGMTDSQVTTYQVTSYHAAMPVIFFESGKIKMTSATEGAAIHYTIDNKNPSADSPVYSAPLDAENDVIVKALASHEGLTDSDIAVYIFKMNEHVMEAPVLTLNEDLQLVITPAVEAGTIRYTLDGTDPDATSTEYSGPVTLSRNGTAKAYVAHPDYFDSPVGELEIDVFTVDTPVLSFSNRVLSMSVPTPDASIRYTVDGSVPTETSTLYSQPLNLTEDCTVIAKGFKANFEPSDTVSYVFKYAEHQVATPEVTYDPETRTVTMTCATEDASIRYTTTDTELTATTGIAYSAPFEVVGNKTFTVRAFRNDLFDSEAATLAVDDQQVPTPTASFGNKLLTLSCTDEEAQILYTLDGTDPTAESALYSAPLALTEDCTVKFIACRQDFKDSQVATFGFSIADYQVAMPEVKYDPETKTVTMWCATQEASIRYSTDGTVPTATTGTLYTGPITVVGNHTYTVRAFRSDLFDSEVSVCEIDEQTVPAPTASFADRHLTLSCSDSEATIHYTLDGTDPTSASTLYTEPLALTEDCTVKFIACRQDFKDSQVATFGFSIADYQVAMPEVKYDPETKTVTMSCATQEASIRYTTDGTVPTATTGTAYTEPITVVGNHTYTVRAFRSDLFDSEVSVCDVAEQTVPTPTASFAERHLTLSCSDSEAIIYYTLDGTDPTSASTLYTEPIALTEDCTVKFIACRQDFKDSQVATFGFWVADYRVAKPEVKYDPETKTVTMSCATQEASIRYSTDGTVPTATTGTAYSAPIAVVGNQTYTVRAFRNDLFDSETATLSVTDQQVPTPTASFEKKMLTLTCSDSKAKIYYTLDGSQPTSASTLYENPFVLTNDCTVKFIAVRDGYADSAVATFEFKVASYRVATPAFAYDTEAGTITISCATENAEIRYTEDGSVPTADTGNVYSAPISVVGNHTFTAVAFRSDLFDSETATLVIDDQKVPTPAASFAKKLLTLNCSDADAKIHYTLDGSQPTSASTLYETPVALTSDCTVKFIAVRDGFIDSEVGSFEFKVANYQVAKPAVSHSLQDMQVKMSVATEGAAIRYTTDGTIPTAATGTLYDGPVAFNEHVVFTVRAFHNDYFDSEVVVYEVSDIKMAAPEATYGKRSVTLACQAADAVIRYTTDGSDPTENSALYDSPIPMTQDCTVRFVALKEGYAMSDAGSYTFVLADWQVKSPTFSKDFEGRKITINHEEGLQVTVGTGDSSQTLPTPATLDVTPDMSELTAVAVALDEDFFDSPKMTEPIVFHKAPAMTYDGHTLSVTAAADDPAASAAECQLFIDGALSADGAAELRQDIVAFCNATARVKSENAFIGEPSEMRIDVFNTGRVAGARDGHSIAEAFGTWGDSMDSYTYLRVKGEIAYADLKTISTLPQLTTLHIDADIVEDNDCGGIFSGSRIETICSTSFPQGMLTGMPRLTTVISCRKGEKMPEGIMEEAGNPNLLIWVESADDAPSGAGNVVVYTADGEGSATDPAGNGVEGHAASIALKAGSPFNAHMPLTADFIKVEKEFTLPTEVDVCAGWETLTLPFAPDSIIHENSGRIIPFSNWDESNLNGPKPFWLYRADGGDWEAASDIEAGIPYIISMPNSQDYVEAFNLAGKVTFLANDVTIGTEDTFPAVTDWKDGATFEGTFMPVEENDILSLNVNATEEGVYPGSAFVADDETLPFGAFVRASGSRKSIPVFDSGNGVQLPTVSADGLRVESPAPGMLRISTSRVCNTAIVTPEGAVVRKLRLQAGDTQTVEGLTRGVYIVAGLKVMVK